MTAVIGARFGPSYRELDMLVAYLVAVWVHVMAAATLVGGMLFFVVVVVPWTRGLEPPQRTATLETIGRRFRVVTWASLALLAATGVFNLWARGIRPEDVLRPEWRATTLGHTVVAKVGLAILLAALCLGHDRVRHRATAKWLGRLALVVILVIVAVAIELVRGV